MRIGIAGILNKPIVSNSTGGTEAFTYELTELLVKRSHDVTLFATSDSKVSAKLISVCSSTDTKGVIEAGMETRIPYHLLQSRKIAQDSSQFDVIHNNYFDSFFFTAFDNMIQCPIVTTVHSDYWQYPNLQKVLKQTHREGKDAIVFVSKRAQELAGNPRDSVVIYNGVQYDQYPIGNGAGGYLLWLSRIKEEKGTREAVQVALQTNIKLIVDGYAPLKEENQEYYNLFVKPYLSDVIQHVDTSNAPEEKVRLYQGASAFLFPIQWEEPFGLVMIEAMACGTPVIAYNRGSVPEVVQDGVTGFIIDPDDEDRPGNDTWVIKQKGIAGLVEAVKRIGEIDRKLCRAHVEKNFTVEKMVDGYEEIYKKLINSQ